jgi:hypothetical protein
MDFSLLLQVVGYTACIAVALFLVLKQLAHGFTPNPPMMIAAVAVIAIGVWWVASDYGSAAPPSASVENRIRGVAEFVRVEETPLTVNNRPQVRLQLRIELSGKPPYEQELLAFVPRGQSAQPGRRVWILVSPDPGSEPILDWTTAPPERTPG